MRATPFPILSMCALRLLLTSLLACFAVSTSAGPTEYTVVLEGAGERHAASLEAQGFVVEALLPDGLRLNCTPRELQAITGMGLPYRVLHWIGGAGQAKQLTGYPSYAEMTSQLEAHAAENPDITELFSVGQSVQGRELWVLRITSQPGTEENEPEFTYIGSMHGDEPGGLVLCMNLIDWLLDQYGANPRVTDLVNGTDIAIMPLMNPDGYVAGTRRNAEGLDLNRSFPAIGLDFVAPFFDGGNLAIGGRTAEVAAVMEWMRGNSFALGANLHTGATVVNYPYDDGDAASGEYAACPDDALFVHLAQQYANANPAMLDSRFFPGGITNGSDWYRIVGGMQDWSYRYLGSPHVTIELSDIKTPPAETLQAFWEDNREAMLTYMESVHRGARGVVYDRDSGTPLGAKVLVEGNEQPVFTDPGVGDYHRLLLPGTYTLRFHAAGYIPYTIPSVIVSEDAAAAADAPMSTGDLNGNGMVDASDIQRVVNALGRTEAGNPADVNGAGVSASDVRDMVDRALLRNVLGPH